MAADPGTDARPRSAVDQVHRSWRLPGVFGPVFVVRSRDDLPDDSDRPRLDFAARELHRALIHPLNRTTVLAIYNALQGPHGLSPATITNEQWLKSVVPAVERAFGRGVLKAYEPPGIGAGVLPEAEEPPEEEAADTETHWVEFVFLYGDESPVEGRDYVLIFPGGVEEEATLGSDGTIRKDGIDEGTYSVLLEDVEGAAWGAARIRCDDEVEITGRTTRFDGAAATIRVYRELIETEADALDTLDATVTSGGVDATWKYDYMKDEETRAETGLATFVAEVVVDGRWRKTPAPLIVELKTIVDADWSAEAAETGEVVELIVKTLGFADGVNATLAVWKINPDGDDLKVADLDPAAITGGVARAEWPCGDADGDDAGAEYYFEVTIDDNVTRTARSDALWRRD